MDFFSKNKMMLWTIILLIVLNLFTVSVILFREFSPPFPFRDRPDRSMMKKGDRVMHFLTDQLQLRDDQMQELDQMRRKHFRQTRDINMEINGLKRELMSESFSKEPDSAKISAYSTEIGDLWGKMARLNFDHFRKVSTILDTTQLRKFKDIVKRGMPMPGPPDRSGERRGPKHR